jgi:hypothetical protein
MGDFPKRHRALERDSNRSAHTLQAGYLMMPQFILKQALSESSLGLLAGSLP